jgi:hypothetical protein
MSSKVTVTIELTGYSSFVSDPDMDVHLEEIAARIGEYAKGEASEDWNRKINTDWDQQEDANLVITAEVRTE